MMLAPFLPIISLAKTCEGSNVPKKFKSNTNPTPFGSKSKNVLSSGLFLTASAS